MATNFLAGLNRRFSRGMKPLKITQKNVASTASVSRFSAVKKNSGNFHKFSYFLLPIFLAAGAHAESSSGIIRGVVENSRGVPSPGSLITVHGALPGSDRISYASGSGQFEIAGLEPGAYELIASRAGIESSPIAEVEVSALHPANVHLMLQGKSTASTAKTIANPKPTRNGFFARLKQFYIQDWNGTAPTSPTPTKRGLPFPLDSPPFPNADWGYGGSPDIGAPDGNIYPLMTAMKMTNTRSKIYGWVEPGFNFSSTTGPRNGGPSATNFPVSYDIYPNRLELDQAVIYIERLPDTVQTSHFDWGYHLTAFFGTDYRFTTAKGYFSQQLLAENLQYGFDPVLEYVDLYIPHVAKGMNIRMGRFLSVPGIEAQLAPNNYMYSHSLLYTIDPFTDTGIIGTVKLTDKWLVQLGMSASHDVAPWTPDRKASLIACAAYETGDTKNDFYACANGINDGKYAYNNLQHYDGTWYHRFSKTFHMATEAWYMYERDVPNVAGNVLHPITPEIGANGAFCMPGELRCTAPEYAVVNYLEKELSPKMYLSFRSDFLDDKKGQRTGYATKYAENTLSLGKWIGNTILFRPEVRFDRAYDRKAYDNGTRQNQFMFASDIIYKF